MKRSPAKTQETTTIPTETDRVIVGKKRIVEQPNMTHQAIADQFGISRAAVADMESNALRKVKKALEMKGFTLKDFFGG